MARSRLSINLKNDLSELDRLHDRVEQFSDQAGLPPKYRCQLNLVLEEVFTNIVSYGYQDREVHWIRMVVSMDAGCLTIQVEDDGIAFNPADVQHPDVECTLEDRPIGGLGVHIVRSFTCDIVYRRTQHKNILILKKDV